MSTNTTVNPTQDTLTTKQKLVVIAKALAPVAVTVGAGVACGILIEKMKQRSNGTTEA
jgi:hypothetical protein